MKFNHIISNPPFGRLYLKIIRETLKYSDDHVVLSPIRWLQDPLAEYKKGSDWKKFEDVRERIESLEVIEGDEATKMFGAAFGTDLGIYHITSKCGFDAKILRNDFIMKYLPKFIELGTISSLQNGNVKFTFPEIHGHIGTKDWCEVTSKDWNIAKEVKEDGKRRTIKLNSEAEVKNLYDTLFTKLYKYLILNMRTNQKVTELLDFLPLLPTYSHPWNDKQLYEYFGLDEEEIEEIENAI